MGDRSVAPASGVQVEATAANRERLHELERVIDAGLSQFLAVGRALAEIQASGLYLLSAPTWEAYVRSRWELSYSRSYQLISSAQVADAIDAPAGLSNNALRQFVPLLNAQGSDAVREAWAAVVERFGGRRRAPSSTEIRAVLRERELPTYAHVGGNRELRLAETGRALESAQERLRRFEARLDGRPLPEPARAQAVEYAATARALAEELAALAGVAPDIEGVAGEPVAAWQWPAGAEREGVPDEAQAAGPRCECPQPMPDMGTCVKCGRELPYRRRSPAST